MKFTVVIPLYNKEDHILRAINSVLSQTHNEFELIIVDDGSTDSSVKAVKKCNDSRIRLVQQSNEGVSSARNKGIKLAKYEYIGFLDADDAWKPHFLETISKLIEKHPYAGAYATAYEIVKSSSKTVLPKSVLSLEKNWEGIIDDYFKFALKSPLISASSVVIPKNILNDIGMFPVGIKRGEDLEVWCKIALNYDIAFSNKVSATYFQNSNNRACKKKANLEDSCVSHIEDLLGAGKKAKNNSFYFKEYMMQMSINKSRYYIEANMNKQARQLLYECRYTKLNRKALIKTYVLSFIPKNMRNMLVNFRKTFRNEDC